MAGYIPRRFTCPLPAREQLGLPIQVHVVTGRSVD